MFRLCLFLLIVTGFEASACRTPYKISGRVIQISYLDIKGSYSIKIPARIGDSGLGHAGLQYKKLNSTEFASGEFGKNIKLELFGDNLVGEFSAFSKEGYEAWITVGWNGLVCPTISNKKVKLFPPNA
jgi:hypothetical protein